ncbi:serine hydrolase [Moellerella wisconsensis]|uniref:serine-type D-Ala-D-Ala carboxypeptidase n=2 Tax=Moellerella wisconsensis TaxID=158849 RepID=A0A9Q8Q3K6_9GAMM|nr:serine hydrolase [Moellerella wisconsensis]KLN96082.1 D-alanyl-D-alanine carboxypeptidase [Moellerella wisconsensis]UNH28094.1 serine hydrolase [Moellerella wisconsensis]UNH31602.1 serine hydrolase [Moellerella wisconsensis]UNH39707.1 serine hydrolase [Moellerella wisconsensis]UNH43215.1 serine hydrolase [Moellerella wisconsensis]
MFKTTLSMKVRCLTTGMSLFFAANICVYAAEVPVAPQIDAKAYVLMDYDSGKILAASHQDERLDPASLTKIMTSYVIGQAIKAGKITPEDMVTVGEDAWATGNPVLKGSSLMFLKPKDRVSVLDLNRGIVIQSGNDASIALADYVAGSQDSFVGLMNNYVKTLGLKNTHFKTVHGLDADGQYSTAHDMAILTQAMIRDVPDEYALHKEKEFTFNKIRQHNRNRLLWSQNLNVDGVKTGHTSGAGHNLVASATEGPMRLISVVLGAPSDKVRFSESEKLLTWGFRFFETVTPIKANDTLVTEKVWFGDQSTVPLGVEKDAAVTIPKGQLNNLKASFELTDPVLEAPLTKNQVVGTVNFMLNDQIVEQRPLVVKEAVEEGGFLSKIWDYVVKTVSGWWNSIFS